MLPEEVLLQVQEALYEAPFNPSQWDEFLRLAAAATGGEAAALLLRDSGDAQSLVVRHWSMAPKSKRRHQEDYSALNLWVQAVTKASDWLGASRHIASLAELEQTEFYNDLFLRFQMPNGIFAVAERCPSRVASLSLYAVKRQVPFRNKPSTSCALYVPISNGPIVFTCILPDRVTSEPVCERASIRWRWASFFWLRKDR